MYGVYRVLANGKHIYLSRSASASKKLAEEIAAGLTRGEIVRPDGTIARVQPHPHIAKVIGDDPEPVLRLKKGHYEHDPS